MKKTYDTLYKIDTREKVREWRMEQDGSRYRTVAGLQDGKQVTSEWTQAKVTNAGRANERDPVAQATFEIESEYEHNLTRDYHRTIEGARGGAHHFEPMLAEKYKDFAPGFAQPKLDGIRCIVKADGMWSRQGKPIIGAPHIFEALKDTFAEDPDLILDGELYNHKLRDDFNTIVSIVKKQKPTQKELEKSKSLVQYHVYDIPSIDFEFEGRSVSVGDLCDCVGLPLCCVPTLAIKSAEQYDQFHGEWLEEGYEGSMWRDNKPYEQKRSKTLRKRKEFVDDEFEVVRIEEGLGNWSGVAKRVICKLPDGREFGAGIKGTRERAATLLHETHKVVTIKYFNLTPDGIPRFPVAIKFHGAKREL